MWTRAVKVASLGLLGALAGILPTAGALAHDAKALEEEAKGDIRRSQWFEGLKQPDNGISCCNLTDCDHTQARQLKDGTWEAVLHDYKGYRWVKIPPEKVIRTPKSIDGEAYLCSSMGSAGGETNYTPGSPSTFKSPGYEATIYCFVPPIPGY